MCNFFSLRSDGIGNIFYLNAEQRKTCGNNDPDSHSYIAEYYKFKGIDDDFLNKYEFNPLTKEFKIDSILNKDDSKIVKQKCLELDFKSIVPELIIKPIIHPFRDVDYGEITEQDIENLRKWIRVLDSVWGSVWSSVREKVRSSIWDSVWASVWDSVWDSVRAIVWEKVRDSVRASVRDSVWDSVRASFWDSVRKSIRDSVRASVGDSVWDSVRESVWASIYAYISSFFIIDKYKYIDHEPYVNPYQCCIDLWERGLVPSYDGKIWRLHGGKEAIIIYEMKGVNNNS
jgi:hypothetical protein